MDADGDTSQALTSDGNGNRKAVWSPDRRHLAFEVYDPSTQYTSVWRMDSDGGHRTSLGLGSRPAWSPDGTRIAFVGSNSSPSAVYVMKQDGTNVKKLPITNLKVLSLTWGPDGRQLALATSTGIYKVNAHGTNLTCLLGSNHLNGNLSWSSDGKTIAFDGVGNYLGIYTITTGDTAPVRLTSADSTSTNPVWSPDGSRILFSRYSSATQFDIYSVKTDGSDEKQLTSAATNEFASDWRGAAGTPEPTIAPTPAPFVPPASSGNGKLLYSVTTDPASNYPQNLHRMNSDASNKTQIALSSDFFLCSGAVWNADASQIAFIASKGGDVANLWIANADGSNPRSLLVDPSYSPYFNKIPAPSTYKCCDPTWSPDGRFLAYLVRSYGSVHYLWVVGTDGSNPTQITANDTYAPVWSPDGSCIAFSRDQSQTGMGQLFTIKPDGTDLTRVFDTTTIESPAQYPTGGSDYPAWSPDGRSLAFISSSNSQQSVWTVGIDGLLPHQLVTAAAGAAPFHRPAWSPDGKRIAFSLDQNGNRTDQIQIVNADGTGYGVILNDGSRNILSDWKNGSVPSAGVASKTRKSPSRGSAPSS